MYSQAVCICSHVSVSRVLFLCMFSYTHSHVPMFPYLQVHCDWFY